MGSWCHLKTHRDKHVCKLVKKWLTNNVPQILTPLSGMSFPGLHDSCDWVIVRDWSLQESHLLRAWSNWVLCIPFILSGRIVEVQQMPFSSPEPLGSFQDHVIKKRRALGTRKNECWLHTCDACLITTWRLGLRAPLVALVACNKFLNWIFPQVAQARNMGFYVNCFLSLQR